MGDTNHSYTLRLCTHTHTRHNKQAFPPALLLLLFVQSHRERPPGTTLHSPSSTHLRPCRTVSAEQSVPQGYLTGLSASQQCRCAAPPDPAGPAG